jgi:hypothetical protein
MAAELSAGGVEAADRVGRELRGSRSSAAGVATAIAGRWMRWLTPLRNGWDEGEFFAATGMSREEHYRRYLGVIHLQTAAIVAEGLR